MTFRPGRAGDSLDLNHLGVAIKVYRPSNAHVGLLYRLDSGQDDVRFCHLEFHFRLRPGDPDPGDDGFYWAPCWLDPVQQRLIAEWCPELHTVMDVIPYSPHYDPGILTADSVTAVGIVAGDSGGGLTCATFVLDVFHAHALQVLITSEWPLRETDGPWTSSVINALREHALSATGIEDHIQKIEGRPIQTRFLPAEVAAAVASLDDHPIGFDRAAAIGQELENRILQDRAIGQP